MSRHLHCRIQIHAGIKVRMNGSLVETTTGRILLSEVVPEEIPFEVINQVMDKKALGELIDQAYRRLGNKATVILADRLRTLGYQHATKAGISISLDDMVIPQKKAPLLERAEREVDDIQNQYTEGLITFGERYNKVIDIWAQVTDEVAAEMMIEIGFETAEGDGQEGKREARENQRL